MQKSTGLQENTASARCYLVGWITGLIFLVAYPSNKTILFHAVQCILLQIAIIPITVVLVVFFYLYLVGIIVTETNWALIIFFLYELLLLLLLIVLMVVAYKGKRWRLPIIGNVAERFALSMRS